MVVYWCPRVGSEKVIFPAFTGWPPAVTDPTMSWLLRVQPTPHTSSTARDRAASGRRSFDIGGVGL